jgi:DNA-binding transcriptional LysR family regulator
MNLRQLTYFRAIAEEGKITKAAERLHITQPPLSYELASLERELGITLVKRGPRGIELTDAGKLLYERSGRILSMTSATERELKSFGQGARGVLSLGMVSSSGGLVATEAMRDYAENYPDVQIRVHEGNTFAVLDMLERGVVDVGIVRTPFPVARLTCRYGEPEPMVALIPSDPVASPAWARDLAAAGPDSPVAISELDGIPLVFYRRFEQLFREQFADAGAALVAACINDDARTTCIWARSGFGVGLVPCTIVPMLDTKGLLARTINCSALVTRIAVVNRRDRYLPPVAKAFCELFGESSPEEEPPGPRDGKREEARS